MKGKKLTVRWLRVAAFVAAVPVFWLVIGMPVVGFAWMGLVLVAASMMVALRFGWGVRTRSIADVLHDLDAESVPIAVRATSAVSTPPVPLLGHPGPR